MNNTIKELTTIKTTKPSNMFQHTLPDSLIQNIKDSTEKRLLESIKIVLREAYDRGFNDLSSNTEQGFKSFLEELGIN